jgi:iron complex transport system substrate-binding protein
MNHKQRRTNLVLLITLLPAVLLAACAPALTATETAPQATQAPTDPTATADPSIDLVDGLGRDVHLDAPAQRVISLAPSNTELLFAIGAGEQTVGRDAFSDYPAESANLTDIGDTFSGLNTEVIVSLEPDLVLAAEITPTEQVQELEDLGLTVYWLANPTTLEGLYENIAIVGELTGNEDAAEALAADLRARAEAVAAALEDIEEQPTVFYELDGMDPANPWTAGDGTFIDLLIELAGGINIGEVMDSQYGQLSIEEILLQDPDVILLGDAAFGVTPELVAARAGWGDLSAVQNGQVYPFEDNLASRPGPRLVEGLEILAQLLHPEAFE